MKPNLPLICLTAIAVTSSISTPAGGEEPTTLAAQLEKLSEKFDAEFPEEVKVLISRGVAATAESGITEKAIQVGGEAPDLSLSNAVDTEVSLSALLENGPVVLTFYRGGWCPYCNATLRAYQDALEDIKKAGGQLVALTPELPDKSLSTKEKNELEYEILSDVGQSVARSYGVVASMSPELAKLYKEVVELNSYNGADAAADELPLAATYVIDSSGTVRWAFLDADYRKRAEPAAIVAALEALDKTGSRP